jgi:WD40 repeat protein/serine/threonine protein kinase
MKSDSQREAALFQAAAQLTGAARASFLDTACQGNPDLRQRLQVLLGAHEQTGGALADRREVPAATMKIEFAAELPTQSIGQKIGRYKILEKVGEGGCGVVYVAEQTEPVRRRVALKVIKLGMDTKAVVARFEAERQALAMMDHPNIAKVLDAGSTEIGRPYFIMELVRGIKITDYCDQNNLPTKDRLDLFIKICQAIQHAHQKGIIHRDIKPSNILVTLHDGVPVPKVIDFGIAKATEGRLTDATVYTQLHQFIGTPAYMSPEQAEMSGLDIDTRSDIYSLGVLLYELLTGRTPFDAQELMSQGIDAMRKTIREKEPVRPSTKLATLKDDELTTTAKRRASEAPKLIHLLKGDLDWIVMKCLEKDRTRRYETANGLAMDIKRHLNNDTVVARPPSSTYRFQKAFRRNKLAFAAAGAVAMALLLGIVTSTWQAVRATHAEREQKKLREVAVKALDGEKVQRTQAETERQRAATNAEKFQTASIQSRRSQYASDLFAATAEIEKGSYGAARKFLREYLPRQGLEELRGFEWCYLWQLSAGQQLKMFPLTGQIIDIAWSPDGQLIAAGSSDRTLKLLRADTGEVVSTLTTNSSDWNISVAFSYDGNGLATGGIRRPVTFWDVRNGRLLFSLTNYDQPRVACSPVGPIMAVGTGGDWWGQKGSNVYLVDIRSGKEVRVLQQAGDRAVFSRDGKRFATANSGTYDTGQPVILWDVDSGQKLRVLGNQRQVLGMAFSPDGNLLASGSRYGDVILWNLNDFSHATLREATGDFARSVSFSPDGRWLAVAMLTQEVEIWDVQERRLIERMRGHTWEVNAVAYSPDGLQLASGCQDGTIRFWDPHPLTIQKLLPEFQRGQNLKAGLPTFSADSRWLAAAISNDVHIVDTTTAEWTARTVLTNAGLPITFSHDASTLLTLTSEAKTLRRWNVASKTLLSTTRLETTNVDWGISSISSDGNLLALTDNRVIQIFETRTGRNVDLLQDRGLDSIELSPDGQLLAIGTDTSLLLRDVAKHRFIWTGKGHRDRIFSIRFSPDQKMVVTGSWDSNLRLWDVETGKELAVLTGHKAALLNCAFSPDGRTLASKSDDRTIKFWNLATFREVASIPLDYTGSIQGNFLAFSPDGQLLTANDSGPGLRCWRVPTLAEIDAAESKERAEVKQP